MSAGGSVDIIYDFYGLAFFVLGAAVAARAAPLANSIVKLRILALATFGLLHGIYEWMHLSEFAAMGWNTPITRQLLSVVSFLFLFYFALGGRGRISVLAGGVASLAFVGWWVAATFASYPVTVELVTRWGFSVPVAIAAGLAFLFDNSLRAYGEKARRLSQLSAGVLFIYAGLQLFTAPGEYFPTSVFNTANFEAMTGVSVLISRGVCAMALTASVLLLLNSFDEAIRTAAMSAAERAEKKLQLNQLMLRAVFDVAPIGLVITRMRDGTIVEANSTLWTMIGYEPSELAGKRLRDITPARFHMRDREAIADLERAGRLQAYEKEYRRKDGAPVPVRVEAVRLKSDEDGEVVLSVIQDVSAQKENEARLRKQQALAEQATTAKSQFMANMSHELRTPLNGVLGMLELASRQPLEGKVARYVDIAKASGHMLLKLVEDLLDFETLSSGKAVLATEPFDIETLYERAIAPLEAEVRSKGLAFHYTCTAQAAYIGDVDRISQIVTNILGNAVKFTEHGSIDVRISVGPAEKGLRIEVEDSGIGMSPAFVDAAFDRFTQSDASATRDHEGVGLGLSISKGLVQAMKGDIALSSQFDVGTTVTVDLPLDPAKVADDSGAGPASDQVEAVKPSDIARILVAEDNAMNRETIAAILDNPRFDLVFAGNGAEALDLASHEDFDLMILDIQMPQQSGDEVLALIHAGQVADHRHPTPAIACTANAYASQQEQYLAVGFDSVITKPIDVSQLQDEVDRLLAGEGTTKKGQAV